MQAHRFGEHLQTMSETAGNFGSPPSALDVIVALLSEADNANPCFFDRLCQALCLVSSMERAVLFLYDDARHQVHAQGSHGVELESFRDLEVKLEDAPLAQRALAEDRVVEVSERIAEEVPAHYGRLFGITTLTCTPLLAASRRIGTILADRGGGRFTLTDAERDAMWTLGKTAALATTARTATREQERSRALSERIALAREIHDQVVQRLFPVSLALRPDRQLSAAEQARCGHEIHAALEDLRSALHRPLAEQPRSSRRTLGAELRRLRRHHSDLPVRLVWSRGVRVPARADALAQSVVAEALRNVARHARPRDVAITVRRDHETVVVEIRNDGVAREPPGMGMGLRLAAFEAMQLGGLLEFGPADRGEWRVRLVVPTQHE
jgi:signal transduction histidine kinase